MSPRDCQHGQLARSCEVCGLEAERDGREEKFDALLAKFDAVERVIARSRRRAFAWGWAVGTLSSLLGYLSR